MRTYRPSATKIVLIAGQPIVCNGLSAELAQNDDLHVVAQGSTAEQSIQLSQTHQPDILLLAPPIEGDATLPLIRTLRTQLSPLPRIILLTDQVDKQHIYSALIAGVRGYLLKSATPAQITATIHIVAQGGVALSETIQRTLVEMLTNLQQPLSPQENKVLKLLGRGYSNRVIAAELAITPGTVRNTLSNIYRKLPPVRSRPEAIAWAWINGLVDNEEQ